MYYFLLKKLKFKFKLNHYSDLNNDKKVMGQKNLWLIRVWNNLI